ncbi:hypothetical protein J6590_088597 [Homalodisca vitripennis]|nr:hypothetical protein J6590_088597 [Homalodisca vitripennis]
MFCDDIFTFSVSSYEYGYAIGGAHLKRVESAKDLGIIMVPNIDPREGQTTSGVCVRGVGSFPEKPLEVPVTTLRDALELPLLESRRRYLDLMFLHRLLNGSIDCPDLLGMVDLRVPVGGTRSRDLFGKTHQLTSYGYHSIIPRLLSHGNYFSAQADFFGSSPTTFRENILHS